MGGYGIFGNGLKLTVICKGRHLCKTSVVRALGRISLPQLLKIPLRRTLTYSNSQVLKFLSGQQIPEGYDPS
jgi:hypothetical protein